MYDIRHWIRCLHGAYLFLQWMAAGGHFVARAYKKTKQLVSEDKHCCCYISTNTWASKSHTISINHVLYWWAQSQFQSTSPWQSRAFRIAYVISTCSLDYLSGENLSRTMGKRDLLLLLQFVSCIVWCYVTVCNTGWYFSVFIQTLTDDHDVDHPWRGVKVCTSSN